MKSESIMKPCSFWLSIGLIMMRGLSRRPDLSVERRPKIWSLTCRPIQHRGKLVSVCDMQATGIVSKGGWQNSRGEINLNSLGGGAQIFPGGGGGWVWHAGDTLVKWSRPYCGVHVRIHELCNTLHDQASYSLRHDLDNAIDTTRPPTALLNPCTDPPSFFSDVCCRPQSTQRS